MRMQYYIKNNMLNEIFILILIYWESLEIYNKNLKNNILFK